MNILTVQKERDRDREREREKERERTNKLDKKGEKVQFPIVKFI